VRCYCKGKQEKGGIGSEKQIIFKKQISGIKQST
jgi:hypothetical protein